MPHIVEDRILETTSSIGVGDIALAAAVTGFRRFGAVCAVGDTVPYFIEAVDAVGLPSGDYEYGIGTYSAANTLTRTTVKGSSNGGAAVNFAAGSKNVGVAILSSDAYRLVDAARPAFNAYQTIAQSIGLADTVVSLDTKEFDTAGAFNTGTGKFQPTVAGYYQCSAIVNFNGAVSSTYGVLYKNGVPYRYGSLVGGTGGNSTFSVVSALVLLNGTTDYLEFRAASNPTLNTVPGLARVAFSSFLARAA